MPCTKTDLYSSCGILIQNTQYNFGLHWQQREAWMKERVYGLVCVNAGRSCTQMFLLCEVLLCVKWQCWEASQGIPIGFQLNSNSNCPSLGPFALWCTPEKRQSAGKQITANLIIQPTLVALGSENGNISFALMRWSLPFVKEWIAMKIRVKSKLFSAAKYFPTQLTEARAKSRHPNSTGF